MALGRLGVWYSTDKLNGSQLGDLVKAVEGNGYSALWYPESRGYESMSLAGYLLSKSSKLTIGSSIANIYARDSYTAKRALISLNDWYGGRFILGLGVSHIPMVEGLRGHRYDKPIPAMIELRWKYWPQGSIEYTMIFRKSTDEEPFATVKGDMPPNGPS